MSLPAELRNQIYGLALVDPAEILLVSKTRRYRRTVERAGPFSGRVSYWTTMVPNLLLLNQAIYAETRPILYASNTFVVEDTKAMYAFLANIGHRNRANITDLIVRGWGNYSKVQQTLNRPALTMLADAVNLKRINLDCGIIFDRDPNKLAKKLYRDGFHWLEAVGAAKGKFDAGIDLVEIGDRNFFLDPTPENKPTLDKLREEFKTELRRLLS